MILEDKNSVNFITVHRVVLEEISEKEIEIAFYNIDIVITPFFYHCSFPPTFSLYLFTRRKASVKPAEMIQVVSPIDPLKYGLPLRS